MHSAGMGVVISSSWANRLAAMSPDQLADLPQGGGLNRQQWQTIAAVQEHLFPTEDAAPGAADIHATHYLHFVLLDQTLDLDGRQFIIDGMAKLQVFTREKFGKSFIQLKEAQKEADLRAFEAESTGRKWITEILGYIFEALLTDPVYGGNLDAAGWKWLDHRPGFPRPPANKRYFLL